MKTTVKDKVEKEKKSRITSVLTSQNSSIMDLSIHSWATQISETLVGAMGSNLHKPQSEDNQCVRQTGKYIPLNLTSFKSRGRKEEINRMHCDYCDKGAASIYLFTHFLPLIQDGVGKRLTRVLQNSLSPAMLSSSS